MSGLFWAAILTTAVGAPARGGQPTGILVLPPYCAAGSTNLQFWQYTLQFLLKEQLRQMRTIRIPPDRPLEFSFDDSLEFAERETRLRGSPGLPEVIKLGKALEIEKVLWSRYKSEGSNCVWAMFIVDVATGKRSSSLIATSPDWFSTVCQLRKLILGELGLKPTAEEEAMMDRRLTQSDAALESLSRALYDRQRSAPLTVLEAGVRKAIALDPDFTMAQEALACVLIGKGETDKAAGLLKSCVEAHPGSARGHYLLGDAYMLQENKTLSREEFLEAARLLPQDPLPRLKLGELCARDGQFADAIDYLHSAERLEEYSALVHADLGNAYAHWGERDKAIEQLRLAERYDGGRDLQIPDRLADTYAFLHEESLAVRYYQRELTRAEAVGINSSIIQQIKATLADLESRLDTHFVPAFIPRTFSPRELKAALKATGKADEVKSFTNPFASTPEMADWAHQATAGATNELEKAQSLFSALNKRVDVGSSQSERTAEQAFKAWKEPKSKLSCQDYTFLYVALARAAGLKAFYVLVNRDYESNLVAHACAGVFAGRKAILVDATYNWFGVPHIDYEFEDDLQAVALFMAESDVPSLERLAIKLEPDRALLRFIFAITLAQDGQSKEARETLEAGLKADSKSWWSLLARGAVEVYDNHGMDAIKHLEQCRDLRPGYPQLHYLLGQAYQLAQKPREARNEYRAYLECEDDDELAADALEQVVVLDRAVDGASAGDNHEIQGRPLLAPQSMRPVER